jgi:hypothetical protein
MAGRRLWLLLAMVLMVVLSACGSDDGEGSDGVDNGADTTVASGGGGDDGSSDPTSAPETTATTAPGGNGGGGETAGVTEMGSFRVNDTEFAVTYLNRCIPFGGEDGQTIDLQPLAQGQGAQMNLYGTADSLEVSVQGNTVEDMFGSIAFAADPFGDGEIQESTIDGDRWSGSATLLDSRGSDKSVDVTWDVMIPDEAVDCSL